MLVTFVLGTYKLSNPNPKFKMLQSLKAFELRHGIPSGKFHHT